MTRRFDTAPLADELVTELLDLARRAPSAGYSQGVHFLALSGAAVRTFWQVTGGDAWFDEGVQAAPTIVIPLADPTAVPGLVAMCDANLEIPKSSTLTWGSRGPPSTR